MDTETLVVANVVLFALYSSVMLVNARIVGGARGGMLFAASNICRGASMLLVGVPWISVGPARVASGISGVLSITGVMLLHQAFAELLEHGKLLREIQYVLVAVMTGGILYFLVVPAADPYLTVALCGTLAIQFAVAAAIVFRFSGEEVGPAGWLTAASLMTYATTMAMRAVVASRFRQADFDAQSSRMIPLWLLACLITSGATAFGFMSLSTARLRVELLWRAQVDELTGLLNRWAFKRTTMREVERCRRSKGTLAVLMMDLDGLKAVNDTAGHGCGDVVLQAVAGVLQETVRAQDAIGRMGGDEFCILLTDTGLAEATVAAERLRREVEELVVQYRGNTVRTRASIGVTSSEISGLGWQALVDHSDRALYQAKREGKNRVIAAGPEYELVKERERSVDQAIAERRHPEAGTGGD